MEVSGQLNALIPYTLEAGWAPATGLRAVAKREVSALAGIRTLIFQPVAIHYDGWAIPARNQIEHCVYYWFGSNDFLLVTSDLLSCVFGTKCMT
jgi:hypothetical protein